MAELVIAVYLLLVAVALCGQRSRGATDPRSAHRTISVPLNHVNEPATATCPGHDQRPGNRPTRETHDGQHDSRDRQRLPR